MREAFRTDIRAAEAIRPIDLRHGIIGALARFGEVLSRRTDREHAAACGNELFAHEFRAGMEDGGTRHGGGSFQPRDGRARGVAAGIALGGHHHADRAFGFELGRHACELPA